MARILLLFFAVGIGLSACGGTTTTDTAGNDTTTTRGALVATTVAATSTTQEAATVTGRGNHDHSPGPIGRERGLQHQLGVVAEHTLLFAGRPRLG